MWGEGGGDHHVGGNGYVGVEYSLHFLLTDIDGRLRLSVLCFLELDKPGLEELDLVQLAVNNHNVCLTVS